MKINEIREADNMPKFTLSKKLDGKWLEGDVFPMNRDELETVSSGKPLLDGIYQNYCKEVPSVPNS